MSYDCPVDGQLFETVPDLEHHFLRIHFHTSEEEHEEVEEDEPDSENTSEEGLPQEAAVPDVSRLIEDLEIPENPMSEMGSITEKKLLQLAKCSSLSSIATLCLSKKSLSVFQNNKNIDLRSLMNLVKLDLSENFISNISDVCQCTSLRELDLNHNILESITPIGKLIRLERLDVSFNKIKDIAPLSGCRLLKTLILNNNLIFHFDNTLNLLKSLPYLVRLRVGSNLCITNTKNAMKVVIAELFLEELEGNEVTPDEKDSISAEIIEESKSEDIYAPREAISDISHTVIPTSSMEQERQVAILQEENNQLNSQLAGLVKVMRAVVDFRKQTGIQVPPEIERFIN